MLECIDCKKPSETKLCKPCLAKRAKCVLCGWAIPANYTYCRQCLCKTKFCPNPHEEDNDYCSSCLANCKTTCYICKENECPPGFKTCDTCDAKRVVCKACKRRKTMYDSKTKQFFSYCATCKCASPQCNETALVDEPYCAGCTAVLCVTCKKRFPELGQEKCIPCRRPTCAKPNCETKVEWNAEHQFFYEYCNGCCRTKNCPFPRQSKSKWCIDCNEHYDLYGEVRCNADGCTTWTINRSGFCKSHSEFEKHQEAQ